MAYQTLMQAAAQVPDAQMLRKGAIQLFAKTTNLLKVLGFEDAPGGAVMYSEEAALPAIAFRGVNETYTPSIGAFNPRVEPCVIVGGEIVIDNFNIATRGEGIMTTQVEMQIKALGADFTSKFFFGDGTSDPRQVTGLMARLPVTGPQVINAGATAGGAAVSLSNTLDAAIDNTYNPTHILASKSVARKFAAAARDKDVGGYIEMVKDDFGMRVAVYNGLPIIPMEDAKGTDTLLPYTEASASGAATSTSLYIVSFGPGTLSGIQVPGGIRSFRLGNAQGEMESRPAKGMRVEWYPGIALYHGRAVTRVRYIGDLPFVK